MVYHRCECHHTVYQTLHQLESLTSICSESQLFGSGVLRFFEHVAKSDHTRALRWVITGLPRQCRGPRAVRGRHAPAV